MINRIDGFIEQKDGDKYLNISDTDKNSEVLKKYSEFWNGIKDFMKIKFSADDGIPLNQVFNIPTITIIIRNIFEKDGKYYPQCLLDECLFEV